MRCHMHATLSCGGQSHADVFMYTHVHTLAVCIFGYMHVHRVVCAVTLLSLALFDIAGNEASCHYLQLDIQSYAHARSLRKRHMIQTHANGQAAFRRAVEREVAVCREREQQQPQTTKTNKDRQRYHRSDFWALNPLNTTTQSLQSQFPPFN